MNETLILIWLAIAIIGIIAVIIVKLYYSDKENEEIDFSDITIKNPLQEMISNNEKNNDNSIEKANESTKSISNYFSRDEEPNITLRKEGTTAEKEFNPYIVPQTNQDVVNKNISYSSQNQVLINYDDNVQKFQEPITQTQRDIMSQRNPEVKFKKAEESKHELKDLFTIDELIKESKRKDDEREKESKTIMKDSDEDNSDIKESIKRRKESEEEISNPIEEVEDSNEDISDIKESIEKMHEIANAIKSNNEPDKTVTSTTSQKEINEAIDEATNEEEKEEITEISQPNSITDAVIKKEEKTVQDTLTPVKSENSIEDNINNTENTIKTPTLKTPTKIEEDSVSILSGADEDYEFGASIDSSNLFEDENGELSDLDYRKDLAKFTNSIKNSSIVQDIRERLTQEPEESTNNLNEDYIRNVGEYSEEIYDDYEPIINETHVGYFDETPDDQLRQENTRKVFNLAKDNSSNEEELIPKPKAIPEKSSLKVMINNNEEVLRKGDEIIYKHDGETYSSKVYSINGDDIKVKYRRKDITIKPSDIKKIY